MNTIEEVTPQSMERLPMLRPIRNLTLFAAIKPIKAGLIFNSLPVVAQLALLESFRKHAQLRLLAKVTANAPFLHSLLNHIFWNLLLK
jgi:hypothetical protein